MPKNLIRSGLVTALLLLIPLIGMQLSSEINWDATDFLVMGVLIFTTTLTFTTVMQKMRSQSHRFLVGAGIIFAFLYVWAELAVGIFTNLGS